MRKNLGSEVRIIWEEDNKGAVWGQCTLPSPDMIYQAAILVSTFKGRLVTASPYWQGSEKEGKVLKIAYHFDIDGVTVTYTIALEKETLKVPSITPILKSADWMEREMKESYNINVEGHPNLKRLFLDERINLEDDTMIPLSVAMSGSATNTLWERVMKAKREEVDSHE